MPVFFKQSNTIRMVAAVRKHKLLAITLVGIGVTITGLFFLSVNKVHGDTSQKAPGSWLESGDPCDPGEVSAINTDNGTYQFCDKGKEDWYYNFDFAIPAGATIEGIEVTFKDMYHESGKQADYRSRLSWDGGSTWTSDKALPDGTITETSEPGGTYTLGGSTDTWGRSWTVAEINNNTTGGFRIEIGVQQAGNQGKVFVDYMYITVHYSAPDTTPPAAVSDLALSSATGTSIDLAWTAPGDDGSTGTATTYDVRYSTSVINEGNFASATQATGEPTPSVAGTAENMTVSGLTSDTTYYFAIKTSDEVPNISAISNVPSLATLDVTAPGTVTNLSTSGATGTSIDLSWTAPGDDNNSGTATSYDVRYSTSSINEGNWASATQATGEPTPSLAGSAENMTVSGLSADTTYFFALKTSDEVPNVSVISNSPSGTTLDTIAPDAVSDLVTLNPSSNSVDLSWTAPGDNGSTGTSTTYDVRYSTSIINAGNFASATQAIGEPTPSVAGSAEAMTVSGLSASTLYYFAIKTSDEVPNTSAISNVVSTSTTAVPDTTPPSDTTDLGTENVASTSVGLTWTAPGDDGSTGTATTYDVRYSTSVINAGNFGSATQATGEPTPSIAGSSESMTISSLSSETLYYFALKTSDEVPNTSNISNVVSTTTTAVADTTPPAIVTDLATGSVTTNSVNLSWTAPGDDGSTGTATTYDVRYSTSLIDAGNFSSATEATGEPTPSIAGSAEAMTVSGLSASTLYYFAIKTSDEVPNTSAISNVVSTSTVAVPDTTPPADTTSLAASGATTNSIDLSWTAPGDDGGTGTATTYDVRYSTSVINDGNFGSATQATGEPTPSVAGSFEQMTVSGLTENTTYFFALKTSDEVPNTSGISNVVSLSTSEEPGITIPEAGGGVAPTSAHFSGRAYPGSKVEILRKDGINPGYRNVPIERFFISPTGAFDITILALLQGKYFFALRAQDKEGRKTGIKSFNVDFISENRLEATDIFLPPTLGIKNPSITKGDDIEISGYSTPGSTVEIEIDGNLAGKSASDGSGSYLFSIPSSELKIGTHHVRARQVDKNEVSSSFSITRIFRVTELKAPRADFNNDNRVNITDWSIFLFRWGSSDKTLRTKVDLDNNGRIDISDLSIFLGSLKI